MYLEGGTGHCSSLSLRSKAVGQGQLSGKQGKTVFRESELLNSTREDAGHVIRGSVIMLCVQNNGATITQDGALRRPFGFYLETGSNVAKACLEFQSFRSRGTSPLSCLALLKRVCREGSLLKSNSVSQKTQI